MNTSKKSTLFTSLMVVSMVIWGGSWVSAKSIANTLPSETLTFWRFFVNFIALFPVLLLVKEPFKADRKALAYTLTGSLFMGGYLYLFFKGLKYGFAGAAGVLVTTTVPLLTFVLSAVFYRHKFSARDLTGLVFGILGGSILLGIWTLDMDKILISGNLYFLLAALLWALLTICSQQAGNTISPIVFSFLANAFCTLIAFFVALPYGIMGAFEQGAHFWLNIFYLAAISRRLCHDRLLFRLKHIKLTEGKLICISGAV
ncbi:MAG: DMT family transporter [Deltaproteobacteria bacterium]|nr:DMT family transporter [Deltaproteobacteria bacterium]